MGTKTWRGTIDNNYNTAGNWSGGVPITGDDIVFDECIYSVELNLNQSAVDPNSVTVTSKFRQRIGTSSAALQYGTIATVFEYAGRGEWAKFSCTSVPKAKIHQDVNSTFYIAGGTWQDVDNSGNGSLEVAAAAVVGSGGNAIWRNFGGKVKMEYNATQVGRLAVEGGTVTTARTVGTPEVYGAGSVLKLIDAAGVADAGSCGRGGVIEYQSSGGLSPTTPLEVKMGGMITPALNPNSALGASAPAGTAFAIKANRWVGGNVVVRAGAFKFNETNLVDVGQSGAATNPGGANGTQFVGSPPFSF